jgi:hypothetical protein
MGKFIVYALVVIAVSSLANWSLLGRSVGAGSRGGYSGGYYGGGSSSSGGHK